MKVRLFSHGGNRRGSWSRKGILERLQKMGIKAYIDPENNHFITFETDDRALAEKGLARLKVYAGQRIPHIIEEV